MNNTFYAMLLVCSFFLVSCGGDNDIKKRVEVACSGTYDLTEGDYILCGVLDLNTYAVRVEAEVISGEQEIEVITIHKDYIYNYEKLLNGEPGSSDLKWYPGLGVSPLVINEPFDSGWFGVEPAYVIVENTSAGEINPTSSDVVRVRLKVTTEILM